MPIDQTILNELDADTGVQIREAAQGASILRERMRNEAEQDGRSIGASISTAMIQAVLPDQAMGLKLAYATPMGPSQGLSAPSPEIGPTVPKAPGT